MLFKINKIIETLNQHPYFKSLTEDEKVRVVEISYGYITTFENKKVVSYVPDGWVGNDGEPISNLKIPQLPGSIIVFKNSLTEPITDDFFSLLLAEMKIQSLVPEEYRFDTLAQGLEYTVESFFEKPKVSYEEIIFVSVESIYKGKNTNSGLGKIPTATDMPTASVERVLEFSSFINQPKPVISLAQINEYQSKSNYNGLGKGIDSLLDSGINLSSQLNAGVMESIKADVNTIASITNNPTPVIEVEV